MYAQELTLLRGLLSETDGPEKVGRSHDLQNVGGMLKGSKYCQLLCECRDRLHFATWMSSWQEEPQEEDKEPPEASLL